MAIGFDSSSSINGLEEMLRCELLQSIHVHLIEDGALKFFHIMREEEAPHDRIRPIENQHLRCRHLSIEVHRASLISDVITLQMNG